MTFSPITGQAETTIRTSTEGLKHGLFDMPTFDGTINAYFAAPAHQPHPPVILVIQEIFGLHEHIQDVCRRFAHEGYFAIALELYQRQGDASRCSDVSELIASIVSKVPDEQVLADLDASVQWAAAQGTDINRLGVTGFCWGGRLTWMYAAHNPACKAAVAWYGKLSTGHGPLQTRNPVDVAGSVYGPVLGLYGGLDASIPLEDVRKVEGALSQGSTAAKASTMVVYPDAGHAFYADYRPSYRADDARDAWRKAVGWFKTYLKNPE
ncbi:MAG TPA: dienelactone hydrolase family protein [Eoetvoesiella sp.]